MTEPYTTTIVRIMGEEYPIKSDADSDYLHELGKYVENKIQYIASKNKLPAKLKSEVLAAIIIADEYFSQKRKNEKTDEKLAELNDILEKNLAESQVD